MGDGRRATKLTTMAMEQRDMMTMTMATDVGVVDDDYDDDNTSWTTSDEGDNHQGRHSQLRRRQRRLRIDGNDVCASATATTHPVVRRQRVKMRRRRIARQRRLEDERRRRCDKWGLVSCDNQMAKKRSRQSREAEVAGQQGRRDNQHANKR
jgi:hypothetical protein